MATSPVFLPGKPLLPGKWATVHMVAESGITELLTLSLLLIMGKIFQTASFEICPHSCLWLGFVQQSR